MRWIVEGSKESAEATGADLEGDRVMFDITPNYIAEVYNHYRNDVYEDEPDFEDRWAMLSDEQRGKILDVIERYIDKRLCYIHEDLIAEINESEAKTTAEAMTAAEALK